MLVALILAQVDSVHGGASPWVLVAVPVSYIRIGLE